MYSPVLFLALALYLSRTVSAAGAFTDTCANVDVVLSYTDADGNPVTGPEYAACSCYKQVANKINSDPDLSDFLDQLDEDGGDVNDVYDEVSDAIGSSSSQQSCSFPANSLSSCSSGDVCKYICTQAGYVPGGDRECVCGASGYMMCNGSCKKATSCSTAGARKRKRNLETLTRCPAPYTACGTAKSGNRKTRNWECVDTNYDAENCGGCTIPVTQFVFSDKGKTSDLGRDCTSIQGSKKTMCNQGQCLVLRCLPGYTVAKNGRACVREQPKFLPTGHRKESEKVFNGPLHI